MIAACKRIKSVMKEDQKIVIYQTPDGKTQIDVRLEDETVWLTQAQMAELFEKDRTVVGRHISNVFKEGELVREEVSAKIAHTTRHGAIKGKLQTQETTLYNLDVIISVGYRVHSKRGTAFRIWARQIIKDYLVRGYAVNQRIHSEQIGSQRDRWLARYQKSTSNLHGVDLFFSMSSFSGRLRLLAEGIPRLTGTLRV